MKIKWWADKPVKGLVPVAMLLIERGRRREHPQLPGESQHNFWLRMRTHKGTPSSVTTGDV